MTVKKDVFREIEICGGTYSEVLSYFSCQICLLYAGGYINCLKINFFIKDLMMTFRMKRWMDIRIAK